MFLYYQKDVPEIARPNISIIDQYRYFKPYFEVPKNLNSSYKLHPK